MFRRQYVAIALAAVLLLAVGASPSFAAPVDKPHTSLVGNVLAWIAHIGDYLGFRGLDKEEGAFERSGVEPESSSDEAGITVEPGG